MINNDPFLPLKKKIKGDVLTDETHRLLYATDASIYRQKPHAVVRPENSIDIQEVLKFSSESQIPIIARGGGTSLGGQVVGSGIILDFSQNWSRVIEFNKEEKWVRVQPGIVRDDLNEYLKESALFFAPETSTSNRCMIGGMVGNNSCGSHSILYGSTRDHVLEASVVLSDGSEVLFKSLSEKEYREKLKLQSLEGNLYRAIDDILSDKKNQKLIKNNYPKPNIHRRNTGYALDLLLNTQPFGGDNPFNLCTLFCGSEGTLGILTDIKLSLTDVPPPFTGLIAMHSSSINEAMRANLLILKHQPSAIELMDRKMLECAFQNDLQRENASFLNGIPEALVIVEFQCESEEIFQKKADSLIQDLRNQKQGYGYPIITGKQIDNIWNLRKAGLGSLSNMKGDAKPVACIEDTAVDVEDQPDYILDFQNILKQHDLDCIYYGHIGDGELHLRPVLNLKLGTDRQKLKEITRNVATLVKKYRGSLSGEHGDGRVRSPYIKEILGEFVYELLSKVKDSADPERLLNPGKIISPKPVEENLRFRETVSQNNFVTYFDFSESGGMLNMAEKCNGSGDCRKSYREAGTMCPSFMATRDEKDSTRGRANVLREYLTNSIPANRFAHKEVMDVLDLCLSCKACKTECPSTVDISMLKAEYMQHYNDKHGLKMRSWLIGNFALINKLMARNPRVSNFFLKNKFSGRLIKETLGIARQRDLPTLSPKTLKHWLQDKPEVIWAKGDVKGSVYLFIDEFVNYQNADIGIKAVELITKLGYNVLFKENKESGRALLSKGMVRKTRYYARKNVRLYENLVSTKIPLVGIEPSAILMFRDEYPKLVGEKLVQSAKKLASNTLLFEEWISQEFEKGKIDQKLFSSKKRKIKWHGHCQQKVLSSNAKALTALSIPQGYEAEEIKSGCCGMAGSFGFEKEHYDVSMKIGELLLFPAVRRFKGKHQIAASGMSCRHQIMEGTRVHAKHPIELLHDALQ